MSFKVHDSIFEWWTFFYSKKQRKRLKTTIFVTYILNPK